MTTTKQSITSDHKKWYKVAYALANTFNYETGKQLFISLCRQDKAKHSEADSEKQWDYCWKHKSDKKISLGTIVYFAKECGFKKEKELPFLENFDLTKYIETYGKQRRRLKNTPRPKTIWHFMTEGTFGIIGGFAKSGKTRTTECMVFAIAGGLSTFFGKSIEPKDRKVLYFAMEDSEYYANERREKLVNSVKDVPDFKENVEKNLNLITYRFPRFFTTDKEWTEFEQCIRGSGCKIVIVDSLNRMHPDGIEEAKHAKALTKKIRNLIDKYKITILIIHHVTKAEFNKPLSIVSLAGSRVIAQEIDWAICITKTTNEVIYMKDIVSRFKKNDSLCKILEVNEKTGWVEVVDEMEEVDILNEAAGDRRKNDSNTRLILAHFKKHKDNIIATAELIKEFVETKIIKSKQTVHNQLKSLEKKGIIKRVDQGKYKYVETNKTTSNKDKNE